MNSDTSHHPGMSPSYPDGDDPPLRGLAGELAGIADPDGLAHVILFDRDIPKIVLEPGHDGDSEENELGGGPGAGVRPETVHQRIGRQLYFTLGELEPELARLRSGALIRTVITTPSGSLFFYLISEEVHLYGATHQPERTDELDRLMARAANDLREDGRYSQLNFGAFLSAAPSSRIRPGTRGGTAVAAALAAARAEPAATTAERYSTPPYGTPTLGTGWVQHLLERSLAVDALHHVAYLRPGHGEVAAADLLAHPALTDFFAFISRDARRRQYRRLGERLPGLLSWLNTALWAVSGGEATRLVLDVEQGALYFFTLPGDRYLVGVTLDQELVERADTAMRELAATLARSLGEQPG